MRFSVNCEYDIRMLDGRASVVKVFTLWERRFVADGMVIDVFVCLWSLETKLIRRNPHYIAVSVVQFPHYKWILASSPCTKEPELVWICISDRTPTKRKGPC